MSPIGLTCMRSSLFAQDFQGQKTTELISTIILATSGVRLSLDVVFLIMTLIKSLCSF